MAVQSATRHPTSGWAKGRGGCAVLGCVSSLSPRFIFAYLALISPPVALALDVLARSIAEIGRPDDGNLQTLRPGLVASLRTGRDAHRVPVLEFDDLVAELHPPAPVQQVSALG